ncbi:MAG: insulinase family protein [Oligoflexia bacterium]|nr:insulinase family protein [Oligoflexia bacterium]
MSLNYKRSVLKNGIVLATEKAKGFHSLAVGVWVKGGSRHESPSQAGMAHFLEHMMFKGTEKRSALDIARDVDLVGGDFNAMTTREYTCFHLTLPKQAMDFAIELLSDLLKNSTFDPTEIERERSVVLQEFAMVEESPEEWIHEVLFEKCFGNHPLGKPILGKEKVLKSFKRNDILKYFEQHYYSKNIVITMAGDLDHQKVAKKLNHELKGFKGKKRAMAKASLRKPKFHPGITVISKDMDQVHITLACESYRLNHKHRLAAFLMNSFLGGNMSSALFQEIREKHGYAYTVYSSLAPFTDIGLLGIYVATSTKQVPDCLRLIRNQIQKLMNEPISEKDLEIAKNSVKSAIWLGSDSMETRMYAIAKSELFYERHLDIPEISKLLDQVTTADVWEAAKDLFAKDSWNIVAMGPIKKKEIEKGFFTR